VTALLLAALIGAAPSLAQQANSLKPDTSSTNSVLNPGAMRGRDTMGRPDIGGCAPRFSVGLYEWRMQWMERFVGCRQTHKDPYYSK
jgi:hypothetical protein